MPSWGGILPDYAGPLGVCEVGCEVMTTGESANGPSHNSMLSANSAIRVGIVVGD
jgi:hypothetical protein